MTSDQAGSELQRFVQLANKCCDEALAELPAALKFLSSLDDLFMEFIPRLGGVKPATAAILLVNAHASFRAAVRLAFSGQLLPVFMALRGAIESGLYANSMVVSPGLADVWLKRGQDAKSRQACRDEFAIGKMFPMLTKAQDSDFTARVREAYEATIDFGAHPNNRSMLTSIQIDELETGDHALNFAYIHGPGSPELRQSILACAETGLCVFFLALICYSDHPDVQQLNTKALALQEQLSELIEQLGFSEEPPQAG